MLNSYQLLGRVHIVRKEMDQAEAAYLKAIEIDPEACSGLYGPCPGLRRYQEIR